MKAVCIKNGKGPAEDLYIGDIPEPTAKECHAIVRIKAFGLNRMDLIQREGGYPLPPQAPETLGVEFSGIITELADTSKGFKVGDEVFGLAYGGAYAEYVAVSTRMLVHKPAELSWVQAAGIPETWITATQALYLIGGFTAGKSILWHAGASSVSIAGIQLSKVEGASAIYVTTSSKEKIDFCVNEIGATAGFNYRTQDWASEVLAATNGKGVDLIIDFVGASHFEGNLRAAARDGRIVMLGLLSGTKIKEIDVAPILFKRLRVEGSTLRSRDEEYQGRLRDQLVEHALPKFIDGTFKIVIDKVFDWKDITTAHKILEESNTQGKLICTIDW